MIDQECFHRSFFSKEGGGCLLWGHIQAQQTHPGGKVTQDFLGVSVEPKASFITQKHNSHSPLRGVVLPSLSERLKARLVVAQLALDLLKPSNEVAGPSCATENLQKAFAGMNMGDFEGRALIQRAVQPLLRRRQELQVGWILQRFWRFQHEVFLRI